MTKIYLIKHLDSGMKYVGITDGDLAKRWQQHYNDPNSAVYTALRSEGYRMTMELLEDVPSRDEALRKEQDYIRTLGTARPHGWNRMVSEVEVVKPAVKKWREIRRELLNSDFIANILQCPRCGYGFTHHQDTVVYNRNNDSDEIGFISHIFHTGVSTSYTEMTSNPSARRSGIRIYFKCESCHEENENVNLPLFALLIYQHKGETCLGISYYEEATQ